MVDFKISYTPLRDGAIVTGATLLAAHIALWPWQERIPLLARYAIGVTCIGLGETVTCLQTRDHHAIVRFWALAATGGAVTGLLHGIRWVGHLQNEKTRKAVRSGVYQRRH